MDSHESIMPSAPPQFMPMESTTRFKKYAFADENSIHYGTHKATIWFRVRSWMKDGTGVRSVHLAERGNNS